MSARVSSVAIIGRFQPFHWGHFEYVLEASRLGTDVIVGISNPTPEQMRDSKNDRSRSKAESNPFSYSERCEMISRSLELIVGSPTPRFMPCDLRSPSLLRASLGVCDVVAVTIYDEWGEEKKSLLEAAGYEVVVLWRRGEKLVAGSEVRRRLAKGLPWRHLVPAGTAEVLDSRVVVER
jgi:cytidyltransferase-like protein